MMAILLFLLITFFLIKCYNKVEKLSQEIFTLKTRLHILENKLIGSIPKNQALTTFDLASQPFEESKNTPKSGEFKDPLQVCQNIEPSPKPPYESVSQAESSNFPWHIVGSIPVWVGGIALILAGFFLVKYSIDYNLLSPSIRISLSIILGSALLLSGELILQKKDFSSNKKIIQSLSGAGIAVLYGSVLAASSLYHLIPSILGFSGIVGVTVLAIFLSLRYGAPLAIFGLIGGFSAPYFINSSYPSLLFLLSYIYFLFAGLIFIAHKQKWWWLSILTSTAALLWIVLVLLFFIAPYKSLLVALFLIAISFTSVFISFTPAEETDSSPNKQLFANNHLIIGGSLLLMTAANAKIGFGNLEWSLFAVLSLATIILTYFRKQDYYFLPWSALIFNFISLIIWNNHSLFSLIFIITIFAGIFVISSLVLYLRMNYSTYFALLGSLSSLGYYLIVYYKLHVSSLTFNNVLGWDILALFLALTLIYLAIQVRKFSLPKEHKEKLFAIFYSVATCFVSLVLAISIDKAFFKIAFAAELLAISYLYYKFSVQVLYKIAAVLASIVGWLLLPDLIAIWTLYDAPYLKDQAIISRVSTVISFPSIYLGVPAFLALFSSYFIRRRENNYLLAYLLELGSSLLFVIISYIVVRKIFVGENYKLLFSQSPSFLERGIVSNIWLLIGSIYFWIKSKHSSQAFGHAGIFILTIVMMRIYLFDFYIYNPLFTREDVGSLPIFNYLLLAYGMPIIFLSYIYNHVRNSQLERWKILLSYSMVLLAFVLVSLNVRQFFHGNFLDRGAASTTEIYSYSVVWIIFAIAALMLSAYKNSFILRLSSLVIMVFAVGKVFLYDAAALEGLYRVLSFLGLGISLIGLNYFYTNHITPKIRN